MKAAFIEKTGAPDVIQWGELPMPSLNDNQVLVKVTAVAVNPVDIYFRSGKYTAVPPLPIPYIIGRDMVGIVDKIGSKVSNFKPQQRVWSNSLGLHGKQGSFAEYVAVDENLLYHAPRNVDDVTIASVLHAGATACLGLIREAMLKSTDTLFVNGGGGNIGSALIQLGKGRGARVITATSGQEKIDWCKSLGADLIIDYKEENVLNKIKQAAPNGVDVFWDTSRNPNFDLAVDMLAKKGRIILMAGSGSHPPFPVGPFYQKECSMKGFTINAATAVELQQCADIINLCLEKEQLTAKIAQKLSLSEAAKAHMMIEGKPEVWGKIILTV